MLDLIDSLRRDEDLAVLYITHDLGSARRYSDEVMVMHHGRVVERGTSRAVIDDPQHEYTRRLLAAAPNPAARLRCARSPQRSARAGRPPRRAASRPA